MKNKNKKERFEKVVEWEEKPDIAGILMGIFFFISGLFGIFYVVKNISPFYDIFLWTNNFFTTIISIIFIYLFCGRGRKVYWRRFRG